ncbi:MAG: 16S rRNA (cytidine(1402)-2'-O)-methyltransferase [Pseudomonadota bacterium]
MLKNSSDLSPGLYVVSVPIGNLEDITLRALNCLKQVSKIYCEDTRSTRKLLSLYNIAPPEMVRCDDHYEDKNIALIKDDIQAGKAVALLSDAGTPLISDPGYRILSALREQDLPIIPIPGVCAAIAAISVSGLPSDRFIFLGFPPKKTKAKYDFLKKNLHTGLCHIFYERAERIGDLCEYLQDHFPTSEIVIGRELTKKFEEFIKGTPSKILEHLKMRSLKGETVICVYIKETEKHMSEQDMQAFIDDSFKKLMSVKDIAQALSERTDISKKELYKIIQDQKDNYTKSPE